MTEFPKPIMTDEEKLAILEKMKAEAVRVGRRTGADACIVICMFQEGEKLTIQDAGKFPMPPINFYNLMIQAHQSGLMDTKKRRPSKLKIN